MNFMDFGADFHDFGASQPTPNPKRRKYEKPMFYLRKTYVFEGPGLSFWVEKSIKNDVGTRCGIGTDFFMIFGRFWSPFWGPKSINNDKSAMSKSDSNSETEKEARCGRLAAGAEVPGTRIRRFRRGFNCKVQARRDPEGGGGSNGLKPPAASPRSIWFWNSVLGAME